MYANDFLEVEARKKLLCGDVLFITLSSIFFFHIGLSFVVKSKNKKPNQTKPNKQTNKQNIHTNKQAKHTHKQNKIKTKQ